MLKNQYLLKISSRQVNYKIQLIYEIIKIDIINVVSQP